MRQRVAVAAQDGDVGQFCVPGSTVSERVKVMHLELRVRPRNEIADHAFFPVVAKGLSADLRMSLGYR